MRLRNSATRWGAVAQLLHWTVVVLIMAQFVLGYRAANLPLGLQQLVLLARHKSFGMTILLLAVLRIVWRALSRRPALPAGTKRWEAVATHASHSLLYLLLLAIPLSGWMMSSARSFPVGWFGMFYFPDLVAPGETMFELMQRTHRALTVALLVVTVLHALVALKHHFVARDTVMRGMLPWGG
jgi:cytochrome b561